MTPRARREPRPPPPAWLTGHADLGAVPALLQHLATGLSPAIIDELWLFPTRRLAGFESTVLVLSLYADQPERRRVATVHFKVVRNKRGQAGVERLIEEQAIAPAERLTRVIDGVLRRLGDDLAATPQSARITGEPLRYAALIESIASNIDFEDALQRVQERADRDGRTGEEAAAETDVEGEPELEVEESDFAGELPYGSNVRVSRETSEPHSPDTVSVLSELPAPDIPDEGGQ